MIKRITGYLLAGIGFLGFGYFKFYKGDSIPYPFLWLILFIGIGILGLYFIVTSKSGKNSRQEKFNAERIERLRQHGEEIVLSPENCEVRENSYYEEDQNESMSKARMIDASFDPNRNYRQHFVVQTALIFLYKSGDTNLRMTSQPFPFAKDIMNGYLERGLISLFVNRFDKNDYVFDLKS